MTITTAAACEGCEGVSELPPITRYGYCLPCAEQACGTGRGDDVGLPVPPGGQTIYDHMGVPAAWVHPVGVEALNRYVQFADDRDTDYDFDPVIAFASITCGDCDTVSDEMSDEQRAAHLLVDEWVVIGCEGYVTPILRAAVVAVPEVLFEGGWTVEARCQRCNETFLPADAGDLDHQARADGRECGGPGVPTARWRSEQVRPLTPVDPYRARLNAAVGEMRLLLRDWSQHTDTALVTLMQELLTAYGFWDDADAGAAADRRATFNKGVDPDELAYDGWSNEPQKRPLTARERDILCRMLGQALRPANQPRRPSSPPSVLAGLIDCYEAPVTVEAGEVELLRMMRFVLTPRHD
jgi:hypothetical protein